MSIKDEIIKCRYCGCDVEEWLEGEACERCKWIDRIDIVYDAWRDEQLRKGLKGGDS